MTINATPSTHPSAVLRVAKLIVLFLISLFLFILGLELIKRGAKPLTSWFKPEGATTVGGALGAGWLLACVVLSG